MTEYPIYLVTGTTFSRDIHRAFLTLDQAKKYVEIEKGFDSTADLRITLSTQEIG